MRERRGAARNLCKSRFDRLRGLRPDASSGRGLSVGDPRRGLVDVAARLDEHREELALPSGHERAHPGQHIPPLVQGLGVELRRKIGATREPVEDLRLRLRPVDRKRR